MMKKEIIVLEIPFPGMFSVIGAIYYALKKRGIQLTTDFNLNNYEYIIFVEVNAFGMIEDEVKILQLKDVMLGDRNTVKTIKP